LPAETATLCPSCGISVSGSLLSCPDCHKLIYADALNQLAAEATNASDPRVALMAWRKALQLVPPGTTQYAAVAEKIRLAQAEAERGKEPFSFQAFFKKMGGLGPAGVLLLILSKGKFLLLGLTKAGTFFSMLLAFGVYISVFGWKLAAGLIITTYIHEMGHVAELLRFGIPASAPMFIPGFGAYVRMHQHPANIGEDARVGLAGPLWGLGATLACAAVYYFNGSQIWAAIAQLSAYINLFNLLPFWQLDGGRGFRALSRPQRWIACLALAGLYALTSSGLLLLLLIFGVLRAFAKDAPEEGDTQMLLLYVALAGALCYLSLIPVVTTPL
jgi:Zn-dependent protease